MKTLFVIWMVAAMNMMAPAHRDHLLREAQESYAQADARYLEIATAIINVAFDPDEKPIFGGPKGRSKTALFIAHKFFMESGFRRDVHKGIGRERLSARGYNDNGRSWCMGQLMLGIKRVNTNNGKWSTDSATTTQEGWTGRELLEDDEKCVRATLHAIQRSMNSCKELPFEERLSAYATGSCDSETGKQISKDRYRSFVRRWSLSWSQHPQKDDASINEPAPTEAVAQTVLVR